MVKGNMDSMEGVGQLQRRQVVKTLMELLKSCYPAEHEYLLLRSKQYESMCYSRASTVHHYYQLVSEGFRKIRTAYNGRLPTPNSALATSAGQQVNPEIHNARTSLGATAQGVWRAPTMVNQAAKTAANHVYNFANESSSISLPHPPNPAPAILVNPFNSVVYPTNPPSHVHNPVDHRINHMPATKESYLVNPATNVSQPLSAGNEQLNHFGNPALDRMIYTSGPSVTSPSIHPMFNTMGKPVVTTPANPSLNRISSHMPLNPAANPYINSPVIPGVNQFINQISGRTSGEIVKNKANPDQSICRNAGPMANQMGITAVSPTGVRLREAHHAAPIQASGVETNTHQPHSNGVNELLLSMGMIPESMVSGLPTSNVNITGTSMGNSNQVLTIPQNPIKPPARMSTTQNTNQDNRNRSVMNQIPVSSAHSASSQPSSATRGPGELLSHGTQPVSTNSIGSKRPRPSEKTVQRSHSKRRNSSTTRINAHENSSALAQHGNLQSATKHVLNSALSGVATSSHQQNPLQATAHTRPKPDGPIAHSPNPEQQLSLSDDHMNERIFISDSIHVSLGQVYTTAASCGYKLTAEKIKSLSKEQVLRLFIRARQMALKKACNLPRRENGQVKVSKQQLDTLGVDYQTNESRKEQTGNGTATSKGTQNSSSQIAQCDSLRANMEMNAIDVMPRMENSHSTAYQANKASQSVPKHTSHNSVHELPDHRDPAHAGGSDVVAMRRASSNNGPTSSAAQGTEKVSALQHKATASKAPVVSSKDVNTKQGAGNLPVTSQKLPGVASGTKAGSKNVITTIGAQASQKRPADTRILQHCTATISARVTLFQKKYGVYQNLINQTLNSLLSMGHEGKKQVVYMRYSMHLLTQPAALGRKLTIGLLNTTEKFLRDFLVRYQGIPMKSKAKQSNQPDALNAKGSPTATNQEGRNKSTTAQISTTNQAQIPANAHVEKYTETMQPTTSEADRQATSVVKTDQLHPTAKPEDPKTRQTGTSVTPSGQPSAQTPAPTKPVSDAGIQNMTPAGAAVPDGNLDSIIAQKLNTVNSYVRMALHVTEKFEKGLEQESMLRLRDERISEICNLFQDDDRKKPPESRETVNAEEAPELSLLEVIKAECDGAYKKHKKLMIKITEKWNKPVVECLVAYQCIRLPKMVIHVGGTYRRDLCASFIFEKPPFGWVPVLTDIKKRFIALMDQKEGVSGLLEAWASAAEEVLEDEDVEKE